MNRQTLKHKLLITHRRWSPEHRKMIVSCPWCGEETINSFDAHEYLVKRSSVNIKYHDLIMVPENVAPLHHYCKEGTGEGHIKNGQTKEMALRCLHYAAKSLGADRIGRWYVSLWQEHGLSVKKGWLRQPHEVPMHQAREMFDKGMESRPTSCLARNMTLSSYIHAIVGSWPGPTCDPLRESSDAGKGARSAFHLRLTPRTAEADIARLGDVIPPTEHAVAVA